MSESDFVRINREVGNDIAAIERVEAARMHIANYIDQDLDLTPLGTAIDLLDSALEILTEGY